MSATDNAVVVENVSKKFRLYHERNQSLKAAVLRRRRAVIEDFWALQDVSLEVATGTTFGLIGENGSGKSTLLKCMAKILRPDVGRIAVTGKMSALLELGAGFHPELSGRENVFLNGSILGLGRRELERRFDDIVDFAGLGRFIDEPVKNYSSGMYVRLGFSVAINVDPDVLLIDEVLAVGDESFQRRCNEKFAEFRRSGRTMVLVSHNLGSVHNLCDRVAWLHQGRVKMLDDARRVVDEYTGNVTVAHEAAAGEQREGSGGGRVHLVEMLDEAGRVVDRVHTGQKVVFRLHYELAGRLEQPVFGVAIHTVDGTHVTGPNSRDGDCVPATLEGRGHVDYVLDRLLLLPGTYDLTVALHDYGCLELYDFRHRVLRFTVESGTPRESYGVVSLDGRWAVVPTPSEVDATSPPPAPAPAAGAGVDQRRTS